MTNYILVHGGCHGGWCWDTLKPVLESAGHNVVALDLPGRDDPHADVSLADWVRTLGETVDSLKESADGKPVIVAHSMGGLTASQFAEDFPDDVAHVIFVGAVVPSDGQSGLEALQQAGAASRLLAPGGLVPSEDGKTVTVPSDAATEAFYNRCDPTDVAQAIDRLVPEHVAPLATPLRLGAGFHSVSKRWIAGTDDQAVPLSLQREFAQRANVPIIEIDSDHSPFIGDPVALTKLLTEV